MAYDQYGSTRKLRRDNQMQGQQMRLHSIHSAIARGRDILREQKQRECRIAFGMDPILLISAISAMVTIANICNPAVRSNPSIVEPMEL